MVAFRKANRKSTPKRSFSGRAWKMERASIHKRRAKRPRSNKYSGGDTEATPKPHQRKQTWIGGYKKKDGTKVKGYYRENAQHRK